MTVKQIIETCNRMANLNIASECFSDDTLDDKAEILVDCCNAVSEKLCTFFPSPKFVEICATDEFIDISGTDFDRVISLTDGDGRNVPYRYGQNGLFVKDDGVYKLCYAATSPTFAWTDTVTFPSPRVTCRIFAYGVLAEYFFCMGDYSEAKAWEGRFEDAVHLISLKTSAMNMPPVGRWT